MKQLSNIFWVLFLLICASCEKEDEIVSPEGNQQLQALRTNLQQYAKSEKSTDQIMEYIADLRQSKECFAFKYPINMFFFDVFNGNEVKAITINNKEELFLPALLGGFQSIVFPVTIIEENNEEKVIANLEAFDEIYNACRGIEDCSDCKRNCFQFVFPLRFVRENGTVEDVQSSEDLNKLLDSVGEDGEFTVTFPINIRMNADGSTKIINTLEELNQVFSNCFDTASN